METVKLQSSDGHQIMEMLEKIKAEKVEAKKEELVRKLNEVIEKFVVGYYCITATVRGLTAVAEEFCKANKKIYLAVTDLKIYNE